MVHCATHSAVKNISRNSPCAMLMPAVKVVRTFLRVSSRTRARLLDVQCARRDGLDESSASDATKDLRKREENTSERCDSADKDHPERPSRQRGP